LLPAIFANSTETPGVTVADNIVQGKNELKMIGQIGSKMFFESNQTEKVNWFDAKDMCEKSGLEMGLTTTEDEFRYLYNTTRPNDYWIGARMKGLKLEHENTIESFEWTDGSKLENNFNFEHPSKLWLCLYHTGDDHTKPDYCTTALHKVLCQKNSK